MTDDSRRTTLISIAAVAVAAVSLLAWAAVPGDKDTGWNQTGERIDQTLRFSHLMQLDPLGRVTVRGTRANGAGIDTAGYQSDGTDNPNFQRVNSDFPSPYFLNLGWSKSLADQGALLGGSCVRLEQGKGAVTGFCSTKLAADGSYDAQYGDRGIGFIQVPEKSPDGNTSYFPVGVFALTFDAQNASYFSVYVSSTLSGKRSEFLPAILKLNALGRPDTSFGRDGFKIYPFHPFSENKFQIASGSAIEVLSNGNILLLGSGTGQNAAGVYESGALLWRLLPNGEPDTTLDGRGYHFDSSAPPCLKSLLESQTQILCASATGGGSDGSTRNLHLTRFNSDGIMDRSFATNGIATFRMNHKDQSANTLIKLADGRILVSASGNSEDGFSASPGADNQLFRFESNGVQDSTFDSEKSLVLDGVFYQLLEQTDGMVLAGGRYLAKGQNSNDSRGMLARFAMASSAVPAAPVPLPAAPGGSSTSSSSSGGTSGGSGGSSSSTSSSSGGETGSSSGGSSSGGSSSSSGSDSSSSSSSSSGGLPAPEAPVPVPESPVPVPESPVPVPESPVPVPESPVPVPATPVPVPSNSASSSGGSSSGSGGQEGQGGGGGGGGGSFGALGLTMLGLGVWRRRQRAR